MNNIYAICAAGDISNRRARAFSLLRVENGKEVPWYIFVVRWDGQYFGYVNRCPHQGVNLDWERNQFLEPGTRRIMCGKHGSQFELETGVCIGGPCAGKALEAVPLCLADGDVCVMGVTLAEEAE